MRLMMIELAAIEMETPSGIDCEVTGHLAGAYIEKGDRRANCAGNLPIIVREVESGGYVVLEGSPRLSQSQVRVFAARLAAQHEPWIENVNALVLDEWEVESAERQASIERGEFERISDSYAEEDEN